MKLDTRKYRYYPPAWKQLIRATAELHDAAVALTKARRA